LRDVPRMPRAVCCTQSFYVLIAGMPNVGKSTIINSMRERVMANARTSAAAAEPTAAAGRRGSAASKQPRALERTARTGAPKYAEDTRTKLARTGALPGVTRDLQVWCEQRGCFPQGSRAAHERALWAAH
jgi:hypothetical protein